MRRSFVLAAATAAALFTVPASSASFSGYDVALLGSAAVLGNGELQLTAGTNYEAGAAWWTTPLSTANSFAITFDFSLLRLTDGDTMADGIALALHGMGTGALNSNGGNLGYYGLDAVGSVIQTYTNNKVGLNTTGNPYDTQNAPESAPGVVLSLGSAASIQGTQTVTYDAVTHMLSMTGSLAVDGVLYSVNDSVSIDLAMRFGPTLTAGFTGGTGGNIADQRITSFSVSAVPEPESWALLLAGLGVVAYGLRRIQARAPSPASSIA